MKVYIAGPMTGYPEYNAAAFRFAAERWRVHFNCDPVTPLDTDSIVWRRHFGRDFDPATDKCDYGDPLLGEMFAENIKALTDAGLVAVLPKWEKSRGASLEVGIARALGYPVVDAVTGDGITVSETVLEEAQRLVFGNRQADYGHPIEDFTRTGRMWGAILGTEDVAPEKVALCMVALKISRECHRPKRDNIVDGAGYFATLALVRERQSGPPTRDVNG